MKNLKKYSYTLLLLIISFLSQLSAEMMDFEINYLNVSVAKVNFTLNEQQLRIKAVSTRITTFLADTIDNTYTVNYRDLFIPVTYSKNINQKKFKENSVTSYQADTAIYKNYIKKFNLF